MSKTKKSEADTAGIGHNSGEVSGARIKAFVERIEKLEDEKSLTAADIKDVYSEAKGVGFDAPTIKKLIAERKLSKEKVNEQYELLDLYRCAVDNASK